MLQKPSQGNSWLVSQFLQPCLLKSLLFLSLGNFSITQINHQLQIHERLHAISSSVRSNETSINLACFILLQLGNILSKSRQNLFTRRAKKKNKIKNQEEQQTTPSRALFSMMEQSYIKQGQFKINGFQRWCLEATAPAAFQQLEIRRKFQTLTGDWYKPSCREFQQLKSDSHLSTTSG